MGGGCVMGHLESSCLVHSQHGWTVPFRSGEHLGFRQRSSFRPFRLVRRAPLGRLSARPRRQKRRARLALRRVRTPQPPRRRSARPTATSTSSPTLARGRRCTLCPVGVTQTGRRLLRRPLPDGSWPVPRRAPQQSLLRRAPSDAPMTPSRRRRAARLRTRSTSRDRRFAPQLAPLPAEGSRARPCRHGARRARSAPLRHGCVAPRWLARRRARDAGSGLSAPNPRLSSASAALHRAAPRAPTAPPASSVPERTRRRRTLPRRLRGTR